MAQEIKARNRELDETYSKLTFETTLLGKTTEEQKRLNAEYAIQLKYRKAIFDIENDKSLSPDGANKKIQAEIEYRDKALRNLNTEIANDAAEKLLAEYNRIRDGISDAIVTALFEGGKAGSKKIRDMLVAELKKPITVVVKALVNTLMDNVTGGVTGAASSGAMGALGAAFVGTSSALGLGAQAGFGALMNGGLFEAVGAGFTTMLEGTIGSLAAGLGTLAGVLGPIALGLSFLSSLDHSGTIHTGGAATWNATTGSTSATAAQLSKGNALGSGFADIAYSQSTTSAVSNFAKGIGTALDSVAGTFGKKAGYEIATAFADDTSKDASWEIGRAHV